MPDSRGEDARLLVLVGIAGAALFIVTVALVVLASTFAPIFGLDVGAPDPTIVLILLVWAAVALGILPAAALAGFLRRDRKDEDGG